MNVDTTKDKAEEVARIVTHLQKKIGMIRTPVECEMAAERIFRIEQLKKEKNALLLCHNYQLPEIYHGVADICGDSLALARQSVNAQADMIVFCGVHFMAETTKIVNPQTRVFIPDLRAGCSLSESITAEDVRELKRKHPGVPVVTYVNTSAEVKAETDVCCTSGNAEKIVERIDSDEIIFIPDQYLGQNVQKSTRKKLIFWPGSCEVHEEFRVSDLDDARRTWGEELYILAHPECKPDVVDAADFSGSTAGMIAQLDKVPNKSVMMITECSMSDNVREKHPEKEFVTTCQSCPHMKRITLENIESCLRDEVYEVFVPEDIRLRAKKAVDRMLELS